jgi:predicted naringenin-chalcone synthase
MQRAYGIKETDEGRKLRFVYHQSGISARYSVIPDFAGEESSGLFTDGDLCPDTETRMACYVQEAPALTQQAAEDCLQKAGVALEEVTHFITVSCTGLSAPGLELLVMERMGMPRHVHRTAVNFMGCYAAVHALKLADAFARTDPKARVLVVCTELCTLHFQPEYSEDAATACALFGDGAAAVLVAGSDWTGRGLAIDGFYSEVVWAGKNEMAWNLSSHGFVMKLSGYIPDLLSQDIAPLLSRALEHTGIRREQVRHWCVHPGGKRILQVVGKSLGLSPEDLGCSYKVLNEVGNLSSATILFVLQEQWESLMADDEGKTFGVAFGPGLSMESFFLSAA